MFQQAAVDPKRDTHWIFLVLIEKKVTDATPQIIPMPMPMPRTIKFPDVAP